MRATDVTNQTDEHKMEEIKEQIRTTIAEYRLTNYAQETAHNRKSQIDRRLQRGIQWALSKGKTGSRHYWARLVDYDLPGLKTHLESLFVHGMTWDNYGDWHVHHIIPKYYFRYKHERETLFKACWSLENLQPLWAKDNVKLGVKPPPDYRKKINSLPWLTQEERNHLINKFKSSEEFRERSKIEFKDNNAKVESIRYFAVEVVALAKELEIENFFILGLKSPHSVMEIKGINAQEIFKSLEFYLSSMKQSESHEKFVEETKDAKTQNERDELLVNYLAKEIETWQQQQAIHKERGF